ncbi:hypothetical protein ACFU6I_20270 [Streptomyces sp. NPDC057486]|uniref:hypothetical protein n=1 Tax=Streptomyces sp. NPDC057486 TaxID=3346145 RepID=UPI0036B41258
MDAQGENAGHGMPTARQKRGAAALSGAPTLVAVLAGRGDDKSSATPSAAATTPAREFGARANAILVQWI